MMEHETPGVLLFQRKIISYEYDSENLILTVFFNRGIVKRYCSVSNVTYQEFVDSADRNKFYMEKINGKYRIM